MSLIATPACLIEGAELTGSAATYYTSPTATTTIIDNLTLTNTDSSSHTVTLYLVANGGTAGTANTILSAISVGSNTCLQVSALQYHVLAPGDFISALASSASVVIIRASGRQCVSS